jgi:hypothetical protein
MSKLIHLVAAFALIGAIGAATVQKADAACGFSNSRYVCR